jgi:hypothetical protein
MISSTSAKPGDRHAGKLISASAPGAGTNVFFQELKAWKKNRKK